MDFENIFLTVWNMSLTGSIIIGVVLLARLALRKAPKIFSYALWAVVLFRLLCPVSVSLALSVLHVTRAPAATVERNVTVIDYTALDIPVLPMVEAPANEEPVQQLPQQNTQKTPENRVEAPETPDAAVPPVSAAPKREPVYYAVILWLVGLAVMLGCNVYSCIRLLRQIEGAVPLRKDLYLADYIPTAFVLGIIRPKIYLPSALAVEERGYIIAHERCHIKRKDHVFRLLAYLALCLHWFNPLVWLAFSLSGKDMEMSCDEAVIRMYGPRIRAEYSQSLLRLATGHRSFALTPLAFGEGDTKERVINMSKWKKPRLWAVLCALIACVAVLVACAVNPVAQTEPTEKPTEAPVAIATEPMGTQPLCDENTDLKQVCIDAINGLLQAESYYLQYQEETEINGGPYYTLDYRRHGENELVCNNEDYFYGSFLLYEGRMASFLGDFWVWDGTRTGLGANETLSRWSPDFVEVSDIWSEGNTISFEGTWRPLLRAEERQYQGTLTFTFNPDGSLQTMERQYVLMQGEELVSGAADKMTVMEESPADTLAAIKAVAVQCITDAELEQKRLEQSTVSDIPSNKTMYDTDYELGAGQMGWKFFDDEIRFKYGAVSDDGSSATVTHYVTTNDVKSIVAEDSYWLEKYVDGKWQYVDKGLIAVSVEKRNVETKGYEELSYEINWSDTYGKLPAGFYRIGRYHTVTLRSGESETRPCYAKFRVMGDSWDVLLDKCADAVEALMSQHSYHIVIQKNLTDHADPEDTLGFGYFPYTISTHTWKFGEDYLEDARYIDRTDTDTLHGRRGSMRRDGICYNLEWSGREVDSPVSFWGTNTYYTPDSEMYMETSFMWIDSLVEEVTQKGNQISVMTTDDGRSVQQELVYTFNSDGEITRIDLIHHPVAGSDRIKESVVERSLEVLDTPAKEIRELIQSQDVTDPMPFTYAMDVEDFPDARKDGFVNVHPARGIFMEHVIGLADMECTMKGQEPGVRYNMTEIYRDEEAKMWKVVLRYSQNIDGDQAIYIDDQGITRMMVTYTEENDPRG